MLDLHVHSHFSCDAHDSPDRLCEAAVAMGVTVLCISDHLDFNPFDYGFGFYRAEQCREAVLACRERWSDHLKVLWGIEIGEPHLYPREMEALQKQGYDCILGSIHWLGDRFVGSKPANMLLMWREYYQNMLSMIQFGGFDVLAHMDFPKRYHGFPPADPEREMLEQQVLDAAAKAGLAIECNTSTLRAGMIETAPSDARLREFAQKGGLYLTVGSDAHRWEDIGSGVAAAGVAVPDCGLKAGYFEKRRFVAI